jgi:hypothetical protein
MHRFQEAEPLLLGAAQGLEASRGKDFYVTQAAFVQMRDFYAVKGDTANAAIWAEKIRP